MKQTLIEDRRASPTKVLNCVWKKLTNTYRCRVLLSPEPDGGFVAFASRLPGVISEGETEDEALNNLADAYRLALQDYIESGEGIPWDDVDVDEHAKERWITIQV